MVDSKINLSRVNINSFKKKNVPFHLETTFLPRSCGCSLVLLSLWPTFSHKALKTKVKVSEGALKY